MSYVRTYLAEPYGGDAQGAAAPAGPARVIYSAYGAAYGSQAYGGARAVGVASAVGLTPPAVTRGFSGVASGNWTATINGSHSGITVTPSDGGAGGTFTPSSVFLTTANSSATFTYTPASFGSNTISLSNDGGLSNPASVEYKADSHDYYISSLGSDSANGATTGTPWLTWTAAVTWGIVRGASYHFNGGDTFTGLIEVSDGNDGSVGADLITFDSYGTGKANLRVSGTSSPVMRFRMTGGITVNNLNIAGAGTSSTTTDQHLIEFAPTEGSAGTANNIAITNCAIANGKRGINFYEYRTWKTPSVVNTTHKVVGITITGNDVSGIWDEGICVRRYRLHSGIGSDWITGLTISGNTVRSSGTNLEANGIVSGIVASCCTGTISGNLIHDLGTGSTLGCGAAFWCQICEVAVSGNEIYNIVGAAGDAAGIDFDTGTFNSTAEYNYLHDIEGAGLVGYQPQTEGTPSAVPWDNNVWRYNVLQKCGTDTRANAWASMALIGDTFSGLTAYGNTVTSAAHANACFVRWQHFSATSDTANVSDAAFFNNIFYSDAAHDLIDFPSGSGTAAGHEFRNNLFYVGGGSTINVKWFGATYTSLASWESAVTTAVGNLLSDPLLFDPLTPVVFDDPTAIVGLAKVDPASGSPLIGAGLDLTSAPYSYTITRDFKGSPAPVSTLDIGAVEAQATSPTHALAATTTATASLPASVSPEHTITATTTASASLAAFVSPVHAIVAIGIATASMPAGVGDASSTVTLSGIPSAEAFGAATFSRTAVATVTLSGFSGTVFGNPTVVRTGPPVVVSDEPSPALSGATRHGVFAMRIRIT